MDFIKRILHHKDAPLADDTTPLQQATRQDKPISLEFDVQTRDQYISRDIFNKDNGIIKLKLDGVVGTVPAYILEILSGTFGISPLEIYDIFWGKSDPAKRTLAFSQALWSQVERFEPKAHYVNEFGNAMDEYGNPLTVTFYKKFFETRSLSKEPLFTPTEPITITTYISASPGEPRTGEKNYIENFKLGEYYRSLLNNPISDAAKAFSQIPMNIGNPIHEWYFDLLPNFMNQLESRRAKMEDLLFRFHRREFTNGSLIQLEYNCRFVEKAVHPAPTTDSPVPRLNPDNYELQTDTYNYVVDSNTPAWISAAIADIELSRWHIERILHLEEEIMKTPYIHFWPF